MKARSDNSFLEGCIGCLNGGVERIIQKSNRDEMLRQLRCRARAAATALAQLYCISSGPSPAVFNRYVLALDKAVLLQVRT
jgi:hypothetical protein